MLTMLAPARCMTTLLLQLTLLVTHTESAASLRPLNKSCWGKLMYNLTFLLNKLCDYVQLDVLASGHKTFLFGRLA